jgi:secreted trypsin-like serine protease
MKCISDFYTQSIGMIKFTRSNDMLWLLVISLFSIIRSSHQTVYPCNVHAACGCSTNSAVLSRIVGGEAANSSTWGWAVSINIANTYLCGGSIISSSWVVTAAHCANGFVASQFTIYAGSNIVFDGTQIRTASQVIVHPSYNPNTYENDIALLQLASPLSMSDSHVSQICLPSISSATLAAGEWPPAGTSVSNTFPCLMCFNMYHNLIG